MGWQGFTPRTMASRSTMAQILCPRFWLVRRSSQSSTSSYFHHLTSTDTATLPKQQLVWSCEMAQASPYLLSLGLSKSLMSLVFVAGPLSGLIVQPIVGVLSDGCRSSFGRRRPFLVAGCAASALALLLLGFASNVAGWVTTTGGLAVSLVLYLCSLC